MTGQSLPVLMASWMMVVLLGDLHITYQAAFRRGAILFYRPIRTA
jgi:hypothetical protein